MTKTIAGLLRRTAPATTDPASLPAPEPSRAPIGLVPRAAPAPVAKTDGERLIGDVSFEPQRRLVIFSVEYEFANPAQVREAGADLTAAIRLLEKHGRVTQTALEG